MIPIRTELKEANEYIEKFHRHHKPVRGHRFSVGCGHEGKLVGVAIVGRPVSRCIDQKNVAEVTRLCTDGTSNACSYLYGLCAKLAKWQGFKRIQTYILATEPGTSLIAAGYRFEHITRGRNWNCPSRTGRRTDQPMVDKALYVRDLY